MPEQPPGGPGPEEIKISDEERSKQDALEAQKKVKQDILKALIDNNDPVASGLAKSNGIDQEGYKDLIKEAFLEALRQNKAKNARSIAERFATYSLGDYDALRDLPETKEAVLVGLKYGLGRGMGDFVRNMIDEHKISEEQLQSPEILDMGKAAALKALRNASMGSYELYESMFSLPESYKQSPEAIASAMKGLKYALDNKREHLAVPLEREFKISRADLPEVKKD